MKTKRLHRMLLLFLAISALTVLSCSKEKLVQEDDISTQPKQEQTDEPEGDEPGEPWDECGYQEEGDPYGGHLVELNFTAEAASKTTIADDGHTVNWVAGDPVRIDASYQDGDTKKIVNYTTTAKYSAHSTAFDGVNIRDDLQPYLYVTYPASAATYHSANVSGTPRVRIWFRAEPASGTFAAADFSLAKTKQSAGAWNTALSFKNVAAILKIGITDPDVTRIVVSSEGGEFIAGELEYGITDSGNLFNKDDLEENAKRSSSITLDVNGAGTYYIAAVPCTLSTGFRVTPYKGEVAQTPFCYMGQYILQRGKVTKLGSVDTHAGQYYVSVSGAGNKTGQNFANAMDKNQFKALIEDQDNCDLLKGATFHFSAEDFSFGSDYLKPNYPDHANVAYTLEGTITDTDTTTFLGRTAQSGTTAGVLWPQNNTYLTVKNVKFTSTYGASNASPIRVNNGAKSLTLDHCYFRNNQTTGNGGGISVFNGATINISNCSFSNATGIGGMIHVNNSSAVVKIEDTEAKYITKDAIFSQSCNKFTCTRVTFRNNDDSGEYGAAAYITGPGTITFDDCDFIENYSSVQGGAVCINGTSVTTTFKDCEFVDNWCDKKGGAVMIESGNANTTFTGGKFQGNHVDGDDNENTNVDPTYYNINSAGGAIYATGSGVEFACDGVLFKSNYSAVGANQFSGGIIRVESATGKATFDECVFDGNYCYRPSSIDPVPNPACAAIINNRTVDGPTYYFNACEFKNNASGTYAGTGAKYGMVFALYNETTLAFNNCSIHDNYGGRNTDPIDWIYVDNTDVNLILSNSTVIGDPSRRTSGTGTVTKKNGNGVFYFSKSANIYFINNILCSPTDGKSLNCAASVSIDDSYYNKTSPVNGTCNWGTDTGSGHDYYGTSASFGSWSSPWTWNGTMTGTNSSMKAATADVNTAINSADSDFYAWLDSIGALGKDINGNNRGATSWPGCYQN